MEELLSIEALGLMELQCEFELEQLIQRLQLVTLQSFVQFPSASP